MVPKYTQYSAHHFQDLNNAPFTASDYSKLKFGSDDIARKFGFELAERFAAAHMPVLLANDIVVIPSPYNHVANAATILTHHFVNRLNSILVKNQGKHVEYSVIHRKVSYIKDYGFLGKDERMALINNDSFYLNKDFYKDKILIFIDDVIITGTHEEKLKDILTKESIPNDAFFVYFAQYLGNDPTIESRLNFSYIKSLDDYAILSKEENHHVIVRPLKYLLSQNIKELSDFLHNLSSNKISQIYHGCLGEGYYKIPSYQPQFNVIEAMYLITK